MENSSFSAKYLFLALIGGFACCYQLKAVVPPKEQPPKTTEASSDLLLSPPVLERGISEIKVRGLPIVLEHGLGESFTAKEQGIYETIKLKGSQSDDFEMQWVLMDLGSEKIIDSSKNPDKLFYGASVSKLFVAGALLDQQIGQLDPNNMQLLADMIVVSSNTAWKALQLTIGQGNDTKGMEQIQNFTQKFGYSKTVPYRGWLGKTHGNVVNASDLAKFLADTYHQRFKGAFKLWQVMHTTRTGRERARRFLPADLITGGKTGTYMGPTQHPDTHKIYQSAVRHHALTFFVENRSYGMVVLTDHHSEQEIAILAAGLVYEHLPLPVAKKIL